MKGLTRPKKNSTITFDLTAPIKPRVGMGGILFTQTLKDFQDALKQKSIIQSSEDFDYLIDDQYFALTIS
ncbi:MAG: hypothetical protein WBG34_16235, partial [Flavobacteriales bacterium]